MRILKRGDPDKVGVLAAGAWGTALAQTMALAGNEVLIWDRDAAVVDDINRRHQNRKRYPETLLDFKVAATNNLKELFRSCQVIVVALPTMANQEVAERVGKLATAEHALVLACKGLRESDGALMSTVWHESCPDAELLVLGGPAFAREVMERRVTAFVLAGKPERREQVAALFNVPFVRVYDSHDMIGVQVGGALKNVMAVAAGILDGMEMGFNVRAALVTRGLAEIARYARMMGGEERTVYGLAGVGDMILSATSMMSRNFRFGQMVGRGVPPAEAHAKIGTVEGIMASRVATVQAQAKGVDLAVVSAVDGVLHGDVTPSRVVDYLMQRPRVGEFDL